MIGELYSDMQLQKLRDVNSTPKDTYHTDLKAKNTKMQCVLRYLSSLRSFSLICAMYLSATN